ncbi:hypothetical protein [Herbaspirillum sp. ST 5-3]|uniref:hypothetical protein n=1 Tax=Oxalobacteraceae TaxID=75682 RepID=UPI0010A55A9D|nr:hypothetical protein [Herbaspirillum sp. ST 5-3]
MFHLAAGIEVCGWQQQNSHQTEADSSPPICGRKISGTRSNRSGAENSAGKEWSKPSRLDSETGNIR